MVNRHVVASRTQEPLDGVSTDSCIVGVYHIHCSEVFKARQACMMGMLVPASGAPALGGNLIVGNPDGRLSTVCVHNLHTPIECKLRLVYVLPKLNVNYDFCM